MPLPAATAERDLHHTRQVTCQGYRRVDGLWDIEAHLLDTKTFVLELPDRESGMISAGEPLHAMSIRITIDMELNILDVVACMDDTPFQNCNTIATEYKKLKGLKIAAGFTKQIRELFYGVKGCKHLLELLGPLATTAFQATHQERERMENFWQDGSIAPPMLNTCHAMASDGLVVEKYYEKFHDRSEDHAINPEEKVCESAKAIASAL